MSNSKKCKSGLALRLLASVLILFGYGCCVAPIAVNTYSRIGQTATISGYQEAVDDLSEKEIESAFEKAAAYNERIYEKHEYYRYYDTTEYDDEYLLLPIENQEICTIQIKKINVNLSVGHGTTDELLQKEAGHLYGTSLPTGGLNTHSVIAGHTALRSSEMFSRLDELVEGDYIDIVVLGKTHRYVVDQIIVCLPEDCNEYLQIEEGRDLITLYTCTPYGINTHRLLVRASRIEDPVINRNEKNLDIQKIVPVDSSKEILTLSALIGLPIVVVIIVNISLYKKEKEKNNCDKKE